MIFQLEPKFWYKKNIISLLLWPLSFLYLIVVYFRSFLYAVGIFKISKFPVPVIVVGNITTGGVGKTPLVIWLAKYLQGKGYKVGIVSRGYGGKHREPTVVENNSDWKEVGDEALIIVRQTHCPIVVAKNRVLAVKKLLENYDCNLVISDDGMQHYALDRDLEIAVIDGTRFLGNGFCLPAGPLREPQRKLKFCDFVVVNSRPVGNTKRNKYASEYAMEIIPEIFCNVKNNTLIKNAQDFPDENIHAVAGIGNPERFFALLEKIGLQITKNVFPDHHVFEPQDFSFAYNDIVIMTEKDAIKCESFAKDNWWYLKIETFLDNSFAVELLKKITGDAFNVSLQK